MSEATNPAAMMAAVEQARAALVAQCPMPRPDVPPAEAGPVHVTNFGESGPEVVIVHGGVQGGLGGGPATFAKQEILAKQGWTLRMVERPGFGRSPSRGVDDMVADAIWIADLLGDGAHLIGHSWGGAEALLAAARRPEAVRSLTLIEPALMPLLSTEPSLRADPRLMRVGAQIGGMLLSSRTPADYAVAFARSLGAEGAAEPNDRVTALEGDAALATSFGCAMLQARMAPPPVMRAAAEAVARAGVPVLVVSGGWSPMFDFVSEVAARLTGGRFEIVAAPNHFLQAVSAEAFNTLVDRFMREADARPRP